MKGFKITNKDMTCRNYQYELNKEFILDEDKEGELQLCKSGFHFCQIVEDCFKYYNFTNGERLFEIEATGRTIFEIDKTVTDKIKFLRELTKEELYVIFSDPTFCNKGINNIGRCNIGNYNKGSWNKGNNNIGNDNIGNNNIGNDNEGNNNTGNYNNGTCNIGNSNEGNNNIGNNNYGNNNTFNSK